MEKTNVDLAHDVLEGSNEPQHYREEIWAALAAKYPERFEVTQGRKTPWDTLHRQMSEDSRFQKVGANRFRLASDTGFLHDPHLRLQERARLALDTYLTVELGQSFVLPEVSEVSRQREAFLAHFGPEQVARMSGPELLRQLPHNALNEQPMDYWLEFKNDEQFNYRLFGSISGGSAAKFGAWQEKKSGSWRAKQPGSRDISTITEDEALAILEERRTEMLKALEAVSTFCNQPIGAIDPQAFQSAIEAAAPRWSSGTWLHKYLHLNYPNLVTWSATRAYSEAELYRVGVVPAGVGVYAQDIQIIHFWSGMDALSELPIEHRYRAGTGLGPRDHWCLGQVNEVSAQAMQAQECLAVGPAEVGSLAEASALTKKRDIRVVVQTAFQDAGLSAHSGEARNLTELVYGLKEGSIVALLSDASTVVAVGEVAGNYRFIQGTDRPHQVPIRWHHNQSFALSSPVTTGSRLTMLEPTNSVVADLEASLLVNGVGPWPGFDKIIHTPSSQPTNHAVVSEGEKPSLAQAPLPAPDGLARQVMSMLERKRQVILYGPPGTGKTYHAERIALEIVARHNFGCQPLRLSTQQRDAIYGRSGAEPYIASCTFHPMYSYEDFIEGYRPDGSAFTLEPGIFRRMAAAAQAQPTKKFVLIIDEINRGNIPKIFGELITLIEASKRGKMSSHLPLSKDMFIVPDNLLVLGTMNTADRSILLLDTALRRRFAFKELLPEPGLLRAGAIAEITLDIWLSALNRRIVEQLGRHGRNLQVGHSYLMPGGKPASSLSRIAEIVRDEIWPLLQEYCYEDANKLANILGADNGGLYDRKAANLRFELFKPGQESKLEQALIAIVAPEDLHDAQPGEDAPEDVDFEEDAREDEDMQLDEDEVELA